MTDAFRPSMANPRLPRQRGSVLVNVAAGLSLMVILLSIIDLGFIYFHKREFQRAADLAAMAGARMVQNGENAAELAATSNAAVNLQRFTVASATADCGTWDALAEPRFTPAICDNAVEAIVIGRAPRFLPFIGELQISASAIAMVGDPVAAFSVGTRLAALGGPNPSVLGGVLKGIGIDTGLNLMDYNGLAGVKITPGGLLGALGIPVSADLTVADFNDLLAAEEVTLGQILDATATLAGDDTLLGLNTALLNALRVPLDVPSIDDIVVPLGSSPSENGLFAAITSPVGSALDVKLDALGLISSAIGVATAGRGVSVDLASLGGLGPLTGATVTARVGVIEPPSIGIGGVGTTAYSAQTRVFAHVKFDSAQLLGGAGGLLSGLLGTSVNIDLPLVIDLAAAKGTLESLCTPSLNAMNDPPFCPGGEDCADIEVDAAIAKICVGDINPETVFSNKDSCDVGLTNEQLLNVNLLGSGLIGLNAHLGVDVLGTDGNVVLAQGQTDTVNGNLDLGTTVKNLTDALLAGLLGTGVNTKPTLTLAQRTELASDLWNQVGGNACGSGSAGRTCRTQEFNEATNTLNAASTGLSGFLGSAVLNPVVGLLDSVLTLNLVGVLQSVGGLVGGLLTVVGNLLGSLLDIVTGNPCTGGGLLGGNGSNGGCVDQLKTLVDATSGTSPQAGVVSLLGLVLNLLQPILDAVGNNLLMPLLQNVLGLQVGQTDVNLMALECRAGAVLVD